MARREKIHGAFYWRKGNGDHRRSPYSLPNNDKDCICATCSQLWLKRNAFECECGMRVQNKDESAHRTCTQHLSQMELIKLQIGEVWVPCPESDQIKRNWGEWSTNLPHGAMHYSTYHGILVPKGWHGIPVIEAIRDHVPYGKQGPVMKAVLQNETAMNAALLILESPEDGRFTRADMFLDLYLNVKRGDYDLVHPS
jgi:hypothetical protein